MDNTDNYYQILQVSPSASNRDIKRSYMRLCKEMHPDMSIEESQKEVARQELTRINQAYAVLGDEEKRRLYDCYGKASTENTELLEKIKNQKIGFFTWTNFLLSTLLFLPLDYFLGYHFEWLLSLYLVVTYFLPVLFLIIFLMIASYQKEQPKDEDLFKISTWIFVAIGLVFLCVSLIVFATLPRVVIPYLANFFYLLFFCLAINFGNMEHDKSVLAFLAVFSVDLFLKYTFTERGYGVFFSFVASFVLSVNLLCSAALVAKFYFVPTASNKSYFGKALLSLVCTVLYWAFSPLLRLFTGFTHTVITFFWVIVFTVINLLPFNLPVQHFFNLLFFGLGPYVSFSAVPGFRRLLTYCFGVATFVFFYKYAEPKVCAVAANLLVSCMLFLFSEFNSAGASYRRTIGSFFVVLGFALLDIYVRQNLILNWRITSALSAALSSAVLFAVFVSARFRARISRLVEQSRRRKEESEK